MAMFGTLPAAVSALAAPQPTSGLTTADLMPVSQPPAPKPSFFGQGGVGRNIAGYLGDYFAKLGGGQALYAPAVQHQRDLQDKQQTLQQTLAGQLALWQAEQQYRATHPEPTTLQSDYAFLSGMDPNLGRQFIQNKADPIQAIPSKDPNTGQPGLLFVRPSQIGTAQSQRPAIGTIIDQLPGGGDPASGGGAGLTTPRPFR